MSSARSIQLERIMPPRLGSVDPSAFPDEEFDLYSIPAFDQGEPEVLKGSAIGSAKQMVRPGDVLLSRIVPHIRRAWVVGHDRGRRIIASGEWIVFRGEDIDARYLRHVLVSDPFHAEFMRTVSGVGGSLLRARPAYVAKIKIPLPSLPEQRRIGDILDKADALRAKRRAARAQLDTFAQSIFLDMFGNPATNPKGWPWRRLGEVSDFFSGSTLPDGKAFTGQTHGHFLLKVSDMNLPGNDVFLETCQQWSEEPGAASCTCPAGSVVIPKRGGAIGTNKKRITTRPSVLDPNLMAIVPRSAHIDIAYLFAWLLHLDLASITSGTSVPQLNKRDLDPLSIPIPPLGLQRTFARFVTKGQGVLTIQRMAAIKLDELFSALQHRAFRGEL